MSLYSTTSNVRVSISANFRFKDAVSRFTVFASQAAIIARQSRTLAIDQDSPSHTSEPESDDQEDASEFHIFQRALPSTMYSPRIDVPGQRSPTILIPLR